MKLHNNIKKNQVQFRTQKILRKEKKKFLTFDLTVKNITKLT